MSVSAADLGTYLGVADNPSFDTARAEYLIGLAVDLCESVVEPLPAGADSVVIDVAARAYGNPSNLVQQTAGPFAAQYGPAAGGMWLTRQNKATLRRLAGGGGAFMIDTAPVTSGEGLPPWDAGDGSGWDDAGEGSGWL